MKTIIVESWTQVPFIGIQISKFQDPEKAFRYAAEEYQPYGYNIAFYALDLKTMFISTVNP